MFATVVQYRLNPIFEADFVRYWKAQKKILLEQQLVEQCTLHRETKISYIAYLRWQDRESFEQNFRQPQGDMALWQEKIEACCNDIRVVYRLFIMKEAELG